MKKIIDFLDNHAAPEWRNAHKMHSIQLTLFWGITMGIYAALPAFQDFMSPIHFIFFCIFVCVLIAFARLTKQPGID